MKIATLQEFKALYATATLDKLMELFDEATLPDMPRNMNPAHVRIGDTIIGGSGGGVKVKTIDLYDILSKDSSCSPECVHINRVNCYDTRVDVQVKTS